MISNGVRGYRELRRRGKGAEKALIRQVTGFARLAWRAVKRIRERLSHPLRRKLALARLRNRPRPTNVLVLCLGNICRSPYAGQVLRRRLNGGSIGEVEVRSAGLIGPGRPSPQHAIEVASRRSVDLSTHRSTVVTEALVCQSELIVVMDSAQERALRRRFPVGPRLILVLGDLDPDAKQARTIHDPLEQGLEAFEHAYARIDRCIQELARTIGTSSADGHR